MTGEILGVSYTTGEIDGVSSVTGRSMVFVTDGENTGRYDSVAWKVLSG